MLGGSETNVLPSYCSLYSLPSIVKGHDPLLGQTSFLEGSNEGSPMPICLLNILFPMWSNFSHALLTSCSYTEQDVPPPLVFRITLPSDASVCIIKDFLNRVPPGQDAKSGLSLVVQMIPPSFRTI